MEFPYGTNPARTDTPDRERKRMVRLLLEDVTLIKTAEGLTAHLRFRGGATTILTLASPERVAAARDEHRDRGTDRSATRYAHRW